MAKKRRAQDDEAWKNAKKMCRLNVRQLEMARRLGMNPKKLPRLRPGPKDRWKQPVGQFVESLYWKRFGNERDREPHTSAAPSPQPSAQPPPALRVPPAGSDAIMQLSSLACYCTNLADDLNEWCAHGSIDAEIMQQLSTELREIAEALDTGGSVSEVPSIYLPPRPARRATPKRSDRTIDEEFTDDEIPF